MIKPGKGRKFIVFPLHLLQLMFWRVLVGWFVGLGFFMKIVRVAVPLIILCLLVSSMPLWTAGMWVLQGPIDMLFLKPTHYSCQVINELVPHVSLVLASDLYFEGCFISLLTSTLTCLVLLPCLWACSPGAAAAPWPAGGSQLVCCSCAEHHSCCGAGAPRHRPQNTRLVTQGGLTWSISCDERTLD